MEAARLFFACAICLMVGAAAGVFGTRMIYGEREDVRPAPSPTAACPPCPEPTCVASGSQVPGTFEEDGEPPVEPMDAVPASEPGLSAAAVREADRAVRQAVQPCLRDAQERGIRGALVLDLRLTVTGTTGRVVNATADRDDLGEAAATECFLEASRRARFEASTSDGQGRLKLPLRVQAP